jgi:NAD(P)-dependent dehydrogenase (short-subunit alcohol dehydrogenase family)
MQTQKIVLVTGASRGIGAAVAELAAAAGYDVAVNYSRDAAAAQQVVERVQARGQRAVTIQADVSQEAQVLQMFKTVDRELGPLTALVNNAGVVAKASKLQDMSIERWQLMFGINVIGSFLCAREAINRMAISKGGAGGTIVNMSSAASRIGSPADYVDYAASKGAIDTFTLGLGKELAGDGIRVNAVRPGLIDTEIHASGGFPDRVQRNSQFVPMQRGGTAREVAEAVLWLMSEQSSFVTATLVDVAGGR